MTADASTDSPVVLINIFKCDARRQEDLIEHLTVLPCDAHHCLKIFRICFKSIDQRSHFNGFRSGSKN